MRQPQSLRISCRDDLEVASDGQICLGQSLMESLDLAWLFYSFPLRTYEILCDGCIFRKNTQILSRHMDMGVTVPMGPGTIP